MMNVFKIMDIAKTTSLKRISTKMKSNQRKSKFVCAKTLINSYSLW